MAQTTTTKSTLAQPGTHPNPTPHLHHRKIELQSHADLTYLQQNLAKAAREKLELHFPNLEARRKTAPAEVITLGGAPQSQNAPEQDKREDEEEEDPMRAHVRQLVDSFLQQTFTSASHSVFVNGIDASSLPSNLPLPNCSNPTPELDADAAKSLDPSQEIEGMQYTYAPFDPRLQKKLASLHGELENLTAQVSKLRREAPKTSADAYASQLEAALARDEEDWNADQERLQGQEHEGLELDPVREGWNEDVRGMYERGVGDLTVLSGVASGDDAAKNRGMASLTETVGKVQRARNVVGEFE